MGESMARRSAAVISHAPGYSGKPSSDQSSSAVTRASWARSSALPIITAKEIEVRGPSWVTQALVEVPGVHLLSQGTGRAGRLYLRQQCAPSVYLDGVPITHANNRRSDGAMIEAYGP